LKTFKVTVDGQSYTVEVEELTQQINKLSADKAERDADKNPAATTALKETKRTPQQSGHKKETKSAAGSSGLSVKAPMPGSIIEIKVKEGDIVNDGDVLLILEAMKMENELTASQSGTVAQILVKKGDTVNSGDPLIILA